MLGHGTLVHSTNHLQIPFAAAFQPSAKSMRGSLKRPTASGTCSSQRQRTAAAALMQVTWIAAAAAAVARSRLMQTTWDGPAPMLLLKHQPLEAML